MTNEVWQDDPPTSQHDEAATITDAMRGIPDAEQERWDKEMARLSAMDAKTRRNRIAEGFAFAIVSSPHSVNFEASELASSAAMLADALIAELDK